MKAYLIFLISALLFSVQQQIQDTDSSENETKPAIMTLGTFHFAYPNLDRVKTADEDKINMMSPERQKEIRQLVKQIATFKSTKIIIEEKTWRQAYMDSLYAEYLNNSFTLPIAEQYQIAFRLGKLLGLSKIYCVDTWGNVNFFAGWDGKSNFAIRAGKEEFMQKLEIYSDSLIALSSVQLRRF